MMNGILTCSAVVQSQFFVCFCITDYSISWHLSSLWFNLRIQKKTNVFFILCIGSFNYYDYYFSKYMEVYLPYSQFLLKEMPAILDYALYTKSNVLAF